MICNLKEIKSIAEARTPMKSLDFLLIMSFFSALMSILYDLNFINTELLVRYLALFYPLSLFTIKNLQLAVNLLIPGKVL